MTVEEAIRGLINIEDNAEKHTSLSDGDWLVICSAKRHLLDYKHCKDAIDVIPYITEFHLD